MTLEKGLEARVVKDLTSKLKGKYHHVLFHNFYVSAGLLVDLEENGIYGCEKTRKRFSTCFEETITA